MKRIGILGSGTVAKTLGSGFLKHGFAVKLGTSNPDKLAEWLANAGVNASVGSFADAANFGEIIVLAVKGEFAKAALEMVGMPNIEGKTIIDTTNPINHNHPPTHGVLPYFTSMNESLLEQLQAQFPAAYFVKAFNSVGHAFMVNPHFPGGKPSMFICGNSHEAKTEVSHILDLFGWEIEDLGKAEAARAIEPLCILWCLPGFVHNRWKHAFKLLKME
jgi:predicted dinucleotide-binding enzyme